MTETAYKPLVAVCGGDESSGDSLQSIKGRQSSALMNMQHLLPIAASWLSRRKFLLHDYFTEMGF